MDWLEHLQETTRKPLGTPCFSGGIWGFPGFPVIFPFNQSIDSAVRWKNMDYRPQSSTMAEKSPNSMGISRDEKITVSIIINDYHPN